MRNAEFNDARLVEVYDATCPWSRDDDFFVSAIAEVGPARASLDAASAKPGAERVTWIEGTSSDLRADAFDAAVMTSHVAQFFVADDE